MNSVTLVLGPNIRQTGSPPCPQVLSIYEIEPPNAGAHAASMGDAETQAALRKLADEYIVQAEQIESEENTATIDGGTSA